MDCKNCKSQLPTNVSYCSLCGNKVITKRLTIKRVIKDFNSQFFDYDNKIFKTFIHLFTKPEVVINSFIDGSRKTYVNVISYLALTLTLMGFQFLILQKFFPETIEATSSTPTALGAEFDTKMAEIGTYFFDYYGLITILFIPITAIATYVVFINKRHNYAEHIVINMYTTAQYTIIMFFFGTVFMLTGTGAQIGYLTATIFMYLYLGYSLKRIYKLSILGAIWRTIASQILYMMFVGVIFTVLLILGIIAYKLVN